MQNVGYVSIDYLFERYKEEELPNTNLTRTVFKGYVFDVINKLNKLELYDITTEEYTVTNNEIRLPKYVHKVVTMVGENTKLVQVENFSYRNMSRNVYTVRGYSVRFKDYSGKVTVTVLKVPTDEKGEPKVVQNQYITSAIVAYAMYRTAKRLWLTNRLSGDKFQYLEQEYLYYLAASDENLRMLSDDEMEGLDAILRGFPINSMLNH